MTTDTRHTPGPTAVDDATTETEQLGRQGSATRLAVLQHMAQRPIGAAFEALHALMSAHCGRELPARRVTQVLMAMRADGQLARERRAATPGQPEAWLWYSPAARQAAAARTGWRPGIDTQADAAATQAAGAIARARGLATDPTAD